jgi:hypothetical protein
MEDRSIGPEHRFDIPVRYIFGPGKYKIATHRDLRWPSISEKLYEILPPQTKILKARVNQPFKPDSLETVNVKEGLKWLKNRSHPDVIYIETPSDTARIEVQEYNIKDSFMGSVSIREVSKVSIKELGEGPKLVEEQITYEKERGSGLGLNLSYQGNFDAPYGGRTLIDYSLWLSGHNPGPVSMTVIDFLNEAIDGDRNRKDGMLRVKKHVQRIITHEL